MDLNHIFADLLEVAFRGRRDPRIDAVRPKVVQQVLQHVHHVGRHVVEGNGAVGAAAEALFARVVDVLPVPKVFGHVIGDEVMFGHEREEAPSAFGVSRVAGDDAQVLHALAHFDVFGAGVVLTTRDAARVLQAFRDEAPDGLATQDVSGAAAHVALLDVGLELASEVNGVAGVVGLQHVAEVLHDDVGVVVGFHEPVGVVHVVLVDVLEGAFGFAPQGVSAFGDVERNRR